jgi:protein-L-isoaspartate(D-aspartate) O-methyltransferase
VRFRHGDGIEGWKSNAPYDGILVAAAPLAVPEALLAQLADNGRLIMPVGGEGGQELMRYTRREDRIEKMPLGSVSFVPLQPGVA